MVVCKNCGHPVGKVPRGLFVLREDLNTNIRLYSSGYTWLHVLEYEEDRMVLGHTEVPEFLDILNEAKSEYEQLKEEGKLSVHEEEDLGKRLSLLSLQAKIVTASLKGPVRDSRMFVLRCWGKNGRCKCENAEPGGSDDIQNRRE